MAQITIYRSAAYGLRHPMWRMEFIDTDNNPMDFAGFTFLNAYKTEVIPLEDDPTDATSFINHNIVFDPAGVAITQTGMYYTGEPGVIYERFTETETAELPNNIELITDVRFIDPNGEDGILPVVDTVHAINPVTNRPS